MNAVRTQRRRSPAVCGLAMALLAGAAYSVTTAGPIASLDDIQFWTGAGTNRAAIAVDWNSTSTADAALVWGYRWSGEATGESMLRAVLAADPRLFAKLSAPGPLGISVWGVGYDANNDGQFALTDETQFDADGVAVTGLPDEDAAAVDPADWYREGWFTGLWSYGTSNLNPWAANSWMESLLGPSNRALVDGAWDSWTFTSPIVLGAFARNPVAAAPPQNGESADFDADGDVDGADFLTWQRGVGLSVGATRHEGDANGDSGVTALDLAIWKNTFGAATAGGSAVAANVLVPEPPGIVHAALVVMCVARYSPMLRRRTNDS
jgi:hypothetical protein